MIKLVTVPEILDEEHVQKMVGRCSASCLSDVFARIKLMELIRDQVKGTAMRCLVLFSIASVVGLAIGARSFAESTTMPSTSSVQVSAGDSCKLSPEQLAAQRHELIPGLFKRADKVEDIKNGLRFHFKSEPGLLTDLARIMEKEHDCCSFLRMQVTMEPSEGPVTFEVTGPEGTAEMLRKL